MEDFYAVIMAGGGGTRLWPLSRVARPKQTLSLGSSRSLFQIAFDRLTPVLPPERILVVTIEAQAGLLRDQVPTIPDENYILEPSPKGTASVIGLAAVVLAARNPDAVMACLTSDHLIRETDVFLKLLRAANTAAEADQLVTLGITPDHPATGYGYIRRSERHTVIGELSVFDVRSFHEKPDASQAEAYLRSGEYSWNSGMFVWKAARILREMERVMPELWKGLERIRSAVGTGEYAQALLQVWEELEPETIDYGVMEKAEQVVVIPADNLGWMDIGGWQKVADLLEPDPGGNAVRADHAIVLESARNLIYQEAESGSNRLIALLGVDDLIVVDTADAILICGRGKAEEIRSLVTELEQSNLRSYL